MSTFGFRSGCEQEAGRKVVRKPTLNITTVVLAQDALIQ